MPILNTNLLAHNVRDDRVWQAVESRHGLLTSAATPIISVVTEGEIRGLALQFGWGALKQQRIEVLLDYFIIIPLPFSTIIAAYAVIDDYSRRQGISMGKNDVWIAATATVTGARLLTTDKDFDHLQSVFLERDWNDPASL